MGGLQYEGHIKKLEQEKLKLKEYGNKTNDQARGFTESFRTALNFIASPCNYWYSGGIEAKRNLLKMAFEEKLVYDLKKGFRTASITLPFRLLSQLKGG